MDQNLNGILKTVVRYTCGRTYMSEMKMDEMSVLARILNVSGRSFFYLPVVTLRK
jgi:hypothetical protein